VPKDYTVDHSTLLQQVASITNALNEGNNVTSLTMLPTATPADILILYEYKNLQVNEFENDNEENNTLMKEFVDIFERVFGKQDQIGGTVTWQQFCKYLLEIDENEVRRKFRALQNLEEPSADSLRQTFNHVISVAQTNSNNLNDLKELVQKTGIVELKNKLDEYKENFQTYSHAVVELLGLLSPMINEQSQKINDLKETLLTLDFTVDQVKE
jgi:hypothetical protein